MVVPQRTCIGCHQVNPKKSLIRIVRPSVGGIITVDPSGKEKGRGAYVCPNVDCINRALQPERLNRAFRIDSADCVSLDNIGELRQRLLDLVESSHH